MKKNTVRGIFVAGILFSGLQAFAQKPGQQQNRPKTDSLSIALAKKYGALRQEALDMAKVKGWPVRIEKDGSLSELMRVSSEGTPMYYKTSNAGSAITSRANKLYPDGGLGLSLTGLNTFAGIWDGNHAKTGHSTFNGRAMAYDNNSIDSDHPTHVAGTMIGSGGLNTPLARGIAYEGELYVFDWVSDLTEMASMASSIVVSNHSYGLDSDPDNDVPLSTYGKYVEDSRDADQIAYENPYYQIVAAAGNDRNSSPAINPSKNGKDLLSWMATSKNVLVVAAVEQVDNYTEPGDVSIASFSSYGPTDDFRIKPDIATKGVNVYSSLAGNTPYGNLSGTSMASPGVSGVIILLQQHWSNLHPTGDPFASAYMRSATVRALIAHTADEIGANDGPDHMTGWGLINAEKSALIISNEGNVTEILEERTLEQSEVYSINVISDGVNPLVATIAWTDPAGNANTGGTDSATTVLKNNLDLKLTNSTGQAFYPWRLTSSWANPVATRGVNNVDNIEKVEIPAAAGIYTLQVSHKNTLTDGLQDYSLVVTGISDTATADSFNDENLAMWPNPAQDVLNIDFKDGSLNNAQLAIIDVQGRQVSSQTISGSHNSVNISNLSSGVYFVKINEGGRQHVKKILVK